MSHNCGKSCRSHIPGVTFSFLPADIVTQVLNFGLPSPIDIRIDGRDIQANRDIAVGILNEIRHVPGIVDARIQQDFSYPNFEIAVDRTKALQGGFTEADVANSVLNILSGSSQLDPMFFLNQRNGVNYNLVAQTPQYRIQSLQDLQNIPITSPTAARSEVIADVATIHRSQEMSAVDHYNIRRVIDIYASVQGRDLGAAGADVTRIAHAHEKILPRGSFLTIRGQLETMQTSYLNLLGGLGFSILLVYLLIVVNFQSWLDPFIIIMGLPAALGGIVVFLFFTLHDAERAGTDGGDHVHGRFHRQQHPGRLVRARAPDRAQRRGESGDRSRLHALPARC